MKRLTDERLAALIDMVPLNEPSSTIVDIKSALTELQERRKAESELANQRDLSQPVDPQVAEYEKKIMQEASRD